MGDYHSSTKRPPLESGGVAQSNQLRRLHEDISKFWIEARRFEKPQWQSDNTVVLYDKAFRLRKFTQNRTGTPILVLGPQAGHHTCIVDYALPGQSLVALCRDNTDRPVYAVEWKSATPDRRNETIDDLIRQTDRCVEFLGGKAHLVGLCQAGWQSSIYAALYPSKVRSLVLGGAPIDFTAGGGKIQEIVQTMPFAFYAWLVALGRGVMRGRYIVTGFKNMNPYDRYVIDYWKLFSFINSEEHVERTRRFRRWYEYTQSVAGGWYKQAVFELFKKNRLVKGRLQVLRQYVDLKRITCPVVLIAGEKDDITPEPQLFNMERYVSGDVLKMSVPNCGHIGLFIKKDALQNYWKPALDSVLTDQRRSVSA
jgi:poly(3-hydroxybutyrate) depolymerase